MTVRKAVWNQIESNDHRLMRRVHGWRAPRWFRILMITMTRGGDGWLWYAVGLILIFFGPLHHSFRRSNIDWAFLPRRARRFVDRGISNRRFAHHSGNAFPQRCGRRLRDRIASGIGQLPLLRSALRYAGNRDRGASTCSPPLPYRRTGGLANAAPRLGSTLCDSLLLFGPCSLA
jgi:hypothetical protein